MACCRRVWAGRCRGCPAWARCWSFFAALYAVGYDRWISIEHEDRRFEGDEELVKRGFLIARNTLRPLLV